MIISLCALTVSVFFLIFFPILATAPWTICDHIIPIKPFHVMINNFLYRVLCCIQITDPLLQAIMSQMFIIICDASLELIDDQLTNKLYRTDQFSILTHQKFITTKQKISPDHNKSASCLHSTASPF